MLARYADGLPQLDPTARSVEAPVLDGARQMPDIVRDLDAAGVLLDDLGDPPPLAR